jgi:hypothetical protein
MVTSLHQRGQAGERKDDNSDVIAAPALSRRKAVVIISVISFFAVWPLFLPEIYGTHDGISHLVRLSQFIKAFSDGQYLVRWLPDMTAGYGLPVFVIYPLLPYYVGTFFSLLGFSLAASYKATLLIAVPLSGIAMFLFADEFFDRRSAVLSAAAYMFSPYRFVNIYVRGAYNEAFTFIFIPLIFLGIKKIAGGQPSFIPLLALSVAGLMMSHNPVSLLMMPFIGAYVLMSVMLSKRFDALKFIGVGMILGFGLSSFNWLTSFIEKKYTAIQTATEDYFDFHNHFITVRDLFSPFWGYGTSGQHVQFGMPYQIGSIGILIIIITFLTVRYIKQSEMKKTILFFQTVTAISVVMVTQPSEKIWELIPLFSFIQFPWRFLNVTVFASAFLAGALSVCIESKPEWGRYVRAAILFFPSALIIPFLFFEEREEIIRFYIIEGVFISASAVSLFLLYRKKLNRTPVLVLLVTILIVLSSLPMNNPLLHRFLWGKPVPLGSTEIERAVVAGTMPEHIPMGLANDHQFLPSTVFRIPGEPSSKIEIVKGKADISTMVTKSDRVSFDLAANDDVVIRVNIFYFPGWNIYVNGGKGDVRLDPEGRMLLSLSRGAHAIEVRFEDTPWRKLTGILSIASLLLLGLVTLFIVSRRTGCDDHSAA